MYVSTVHTYEHTYIYVDVLYIYIRMYTYVEYIQYVRTYTHMNCGTVGSGYKTQHSVESTRIQLDHLKVSSTYIRIQISSVHIIIIQIRAETIIICQFVILHIATSNIAIYCIITMLGYNFM